ncbi:MAG TPA: hypothetical protein VK727_23740 [Steroidobacteraceae bacterium]|nr:hypothetical protein [Steroidobacteraceae bacterium]
MSMRTLLAATSLALALQAAIPAAVAADPTGSNGPPAANPKGHYSQLNNLPDWGGVWTFNFRPLPGVTREMPALKGKYLESYQAWQKIANENHGEVPHNGSYCRPPGMPGIMMVGQYPIEFLFTPGRVSTHHEAWMQMRTIWTDGRKHEADWDPTFYGDSIGHWEGSTLVVDTVGIKTVTELRNGMPHSEQLHVIEHIHLAPNDPNTLIDDMVAEDPLALAKPWHTVLSYTRARDQELLEFVCAENDRNPVDAAGHTGLE